MAYVFYNPNPVGRFTMDCMPRALAKVLDIDWDSASVLLCNNAIKMATVECSNEVLAAVLRQYGFYMETINMECRDCYTAEDFCNEHFKGTYVLGLGEHVCACIDGNLYDTSDVRPDTVLFFWHKKDSDNN